MSTERAGEERSGRDPWRSPVLRPLLNLPLAYKLLLPYLALVLVVGAADTFIVVRQLRADTQSALDQELARRSVDAHARLHDRELYLEEAAYFASNLRGVAEAAHTRDSKAGGDLLKSVLALKKDLNLVAITDSRGIGIAELTRQSPDAKTQAGSSTDWTRYPFVRDALSTPDGSTRAGFLDLGQAPVMAIVEPVCTGVSPCAPVGVAITGVDASLVTREASGLPPEQPARTTLFTLSGKRIAAAGTPLPAPSGRVSSAADASLREVQEGGAVNTAYSSFSLQGRPAGIVAVALPTGSSAAVVGDAALRLVLLLLAALGLMALVGAGLARLIVAQLRPLVATSRALAQGELSARAPVLTRDEHGQLALVMNNMAEELEASQRGLEEQVRARTAEIQRLLEARTEFFAGMSHELRTPLAAIIAQAEMLRKVAPGATNGTSPATAGAMVKASAAEVLGVVNRILDLARAEAGNIEVKLEPVPVGEVFKRVRPNLEGLASAAGLRTVVRATKDVPPVLADREQLYQALQCVVENAVKYTPSGGRVELSASTHDGSVRISVADSGVGIPAGVGDQIFEPFYRVPGLAAQHEQASSGLGLALARKLLEAQGGEIGFEPRPGRGTVFHITLPIAPVRTLAKTEG